MSDQEEKVHAMAKMDVGSIDDKIEGFKKLLDTIDSLSDKRKELWKEVYENSVVDRKLAYDMYNSLYDKVMFDPDQHAIHGPSISKYLERMSKANDQLLKLAELIGAAITKDESISSDEIYSKIGSL